MIRPNLESKHKKKNASRYFYLYSEFEVISVHEETFDCYP